MTDEQALSSINALDSLIATAQDGADFALHNQNVQTQTAGQFLNLVAVLTNTRNIAILKRKDAERSAWHVANNERAEREAKIAALEAAEEREAEAKKEKDELVTSF